MFSDESELTLLREQTNNNFIMKHGSKMAVSEITKILTYIFIIIIYR